MLIKIGDRGQRIIAFLQTFIARNGYPPTIREIGEAVGISSTSVVSYNIDRLVEAGLIERLDRSGRNLVYASQSTPAPAKRMPSVSPAKRPVRGRKPKTIIDVSNVVAYFGGCAYCGGSVDLAQYDHFVPVSRGGIDSANNMLPACRRCNQEKSDKEPVAWVLARYGPDTLAKIVHYLCTVAKNLTLD